MSKIRAAVAAIAAAALAGCVTPPQLPVPFSKQALDPAAGSMGVAVSVVSKPEVDISSAGCLLCLAAASIGMSSLSKHADKLSYEDLTRLRGELIALMRKKGINATAVERPIDIKGLPAWNGKEPNAARQDFTSFRAKLQVDRLLVVDVSFLGFVRSYSSYFPTGDPKAILRGGAFIVNLKNNSYEWYRPLLFLKAADGPWDEPPSFPGLTNAYYQVIEFGRDAVLQPLR